MTNSSRRQFIGSASAALISGLGAKAGVPGFLPATNNSMEIYYYDNLIPCVVTGVLKDSLALSGFSGFIFPTGTPEDTSLANAGVYVAPARLLAPKYKSFFRIQIGNVIDRLVGKWFQWDIAVKKHQAGLLAELVKGNITGLCYDTEGDAWRDSNVQTGENARAFGQQLATSFYQKMPAGELLLMHAGSVDAPNEDYKYWNHLLAGVLQAYDTNGKSGKLVLMSECTYDANQAAFGSIADRFKNVRTKISLALGGINPVAKSIWDGPRRPTLSFGLWPLGVSPDKRALRYSSTDALKNFEEFKSLATKVCDAVQPAGMFNMWIYGHQSAWMARFTSSCDSSGGIGGSQNSELPVGNIDSYRKVLLTLRKSL